MSGFIWTPDDINVDDLDNGDLKVYADAEDGTHVLEVISSASMESVVRAAQERVAAETNRLNKITRTCNRIREESTR